MQVNDMELAEVTICEQGVNQRAKFELMKADGNRPTSSCVDGSCLIKSQEHKHSETEIIMNSNGEIDTIGSFINWLQKEPVNEPEDKPRLLSPVLPTHDEDAAAKSRKKVDEGKGKPPAQPYRSRSSSERATRRRERIEEQAKNAPSGNQILEGMQKAVYEYIHKASSRVDRIKEGYPFHPEDRPRTRTESDPIHQGAAEAKEQGVPRNIRSTAARFQNVADDPSVKLTEKEKDDAFSEAGGTAVLEPRTNQVVRALRTLARRGEEQKTPMTRQPKIENMQKQLEDQLFVDTDVEAGKAERKAGERDKKVKSRGVKFPMVPPTGGKLNRIKASAKVENMQKSHLEGCLCEECKQRTGDTNGDDTARTATDTQGRPTLGHVGHGNVVAILISRMHRKAQYSGYLEKYELGRIQRHGGRTRYDDEGRRKGTAKEQTQRQSGVRALHSRLPASQQQRAAAAPKEGERTRGGQDLPSNPRSLWTTNRARHGGVENIRHEEYPTNREEIRDTRGKRGEPADRQRVTPSSSHTEKRPDLRHEHDIREGHQPQKEIAAKRADLQEAGVTKPTERQQRLTGLLAGNKERLARQAETKTAQTRLGAERAATAAGQQAKWRAGAAQRTLSAERAQTKANKASPQTKERAAKAGLEVASMQKAVYAYIHKQAGDPKPPPPPPPPGPGSRARAEDSKAAEDLKSQQYEEAKKKDAATAAAAPPDLSRRQGLFGEGRDVEGKKSGSLLGNALRWADRTYRERGEAAMGPQYTPVNQQSDQWRQQPLGQKMERVTQPEQIQMDLISKDVKSLGGGSNWKRQKQRIPRAKTKRLHHDWDRSQFAGAGGSQVMGYTQQ
jgi:hypothetical protein